ncbi:MAG: hypothetical protein E6R03_14025 [Hyphomicrobiaceae bacterium]|nr:MAG: hypothetical protein E6R03_14025 [Hyphomicrobiaceae bacterium]
MMNEKSMGMGKKTAEALSKNSSMPTNRVVDKMSTAADPVRFDRTFDSAAWPTSAPAKERAMPMKVMWKHDAAPGAKE